MMPTAPPPNFTPQMDTFQQQQFTRSGGVGGIRRCMFRNTFVWMRNGNAFWFFPIFVAGNQIVGFRWRGNRGWVYDSINRNNVLFFQCY
ncbi:transporter [Lysinibacillus composti]|uniref:Transporter n=2 Tax=Lysinibacillus composti TaxID=720633 RepID=A0A3N9U737_9BACI|nr:transporter [Lysinibacillus composti]